MTTASHDDVAALARSEALSAPELVAATLRALRRGLARSFRRRRRPSCSTCSCRRAEGARFRDRHPLSLPGDVRALARGRATLRHDDRGVRGPDCGGADGDARREALGAQSRSLPRGRQAHTARPRARRARLLDHRRPPRPVADARGRAELGWDAAHELWKANPLADWTDDDCWAYIRERGPRTTHCTTRATRRSATPIRRSRARGGRPLGRHRQDRGGPWRRRLDGAAPGSGGAGFAGAEAGRLMQCASSSTSPTSTSSRRRRSTSCASSRRSSNAPSSSSPAARTRSSCSARREGVPPRQVLPVDARRHRSQLPRGDRLPRPPRRRVGETLLVASVQESIDKDASSRRAARAPAEPAADDDAARCDRGASASTPRSAAPDATRSAPARKSGSSASATTSASGTRAQRPELWNLYNARVRRGEHVRVFPISNWTESTSGSTSTRAARAAVDLLRARARRVQARRDALRGQRVRRAG